MRLRLLALATTAALATACAGAPEMPSMETMTVDFTSLDQSNGIVDPTAKTHWGTATGRVAFLNLAVFLKLAPAVYVFERAHAQRATTDGDHWVWKFSVNDLNVQATATLTAKMDGNASVWEMRVTGKVGADTYTDFLWYDGRYEVSTGYWQFYDKAGKTVKLDWRVASPTDKELKFTNDSGTGEDGNFLDYKRAADQASVSYDFKNNAKAVIVWSVSTRAGSITAADYPGHENEKACWNADLFDTVCP